METFRDWREQLCSLRALKSNATNKSWCSSRAPFDRWGWMVVIWALLIVQAGICAAPQRCAHWVTLRWLSSHSPSLLWILTSPFSHTSPAALSEHELTTKSSLTLSGHYQTANAYTVITFNITATRLKIQHLYWNIHKLLFCTVRFLFYRMLVIQQLVKTINKTK